MPVASPARKLAAEALGTALLLVTVVGSGILADRLGGGNAGLALLANSIATGGGLVALILTFGPISGAHFNPAVSLAEAALGGLRPRLAAGYVVAQVGGAALGVAVTHGMFELPAFTFSTHVRTGGGQWLAEAVATFGLLGTLFGVSRSRPDATPFAVAAWIVGAYWATASTSFANPAVTLARALTDTFAGIRPVDVPGFVVAQAAGATLATLTFGWLAPPPRTVP